MTRRRGRLQPESLPDFLAALSCRRGREGTDLPGLRLHRMNELLKAYGGGSVPSQSPTVKTDASPSGADRLARRRSSAKSVQVANQDLRQAGRRDDSEQDFCDPGESDHEGCSPISALLRGDRQSTTRSCSPTDYAPSARSLSPVGSCRPEELPGE